MPSLSKTILNLEESGIREIMNLALGMEDVIRLEIGEPQFDTPEHIIEATMQAAKDGYTKYTANLGLSSLRETISNHVNKRFNLQTTWENVGVSVGGVGAVSSLVRVLADAGDELLIPGIAWPNYKMAIDCINATPKFYALDPEHDFLPSIENLERLVTPKTKVIVINSPSNPLGVVIPQGLLKELVEFAKRHDLYLISDEVYEEIIFEGDHISTLPYDPDGRVIGVFSFSKTYSMTGYRLGYAIGNKEIMKEIGKFQEVNVMNACGIAQKAAEAALKGSQDCIRDMVEVYKANMEAATKLMNEYEIPYQQPKGAFYLWVHIGCENATEFAKDFLNQHKVAIAPGNTFGPEGSPYIRISLASKKEDILEGIHRLAVMLGKTRLTENA